jgi:RNA polymerase sigma factor (sigma-70 family)
LDTQGNAEALFLQAWPIARRTSQVRAATAVASGDVSPFDREDLEQEGMVACWCALKHFDSSRACLRTFFEIVVAARLASLGRARSRRPRLLPLGDDVDQAVSASAAEIELRADVQRVLDALPDADRQVALALIDYTPTEVSRLVGVARSTVHERIRHIRVAFTDAGLRPLEARS